jgi:hypothetical protein
LFGDFSAFFERKKEGKKMLGIIRQKVNAGGSPILVFFLKILLILYFYFLIHLICSLFICYSLLIFFLVLFVGFWAEDSPRGIGMERLFICSKRGKCKTLFSFPL